MKKYLLGAPILGAACIYVAISDGLRRLFRSPYAAPPARPSQRIEASPPPDWRSELPSDHEWKEFEAYANNAS